MRSGTRQGPRRSKNMTNFGVLPLRGAREYCSEQCGRAEPFGPVMALRSPGMILSETPRTACAENQREPAADREQERAVGEMPLKVCISQNRASTTAVPFPMCRRAARSEWMEKRVRVEEVLRPVIQARWPSLHGARFQAIRRIDTVHVKRGYPGRPALHPRGGHAEKSKGKRNCSHTLVRNLASKLMQSCPGVGE